MRGPATGLSNPPLSKSTPRRATLNPHVLRVDPAGFRLVLHAADERAAIREDCQAVALHIRDEHPARSTRRSERRQAIQDRKSTPELQSQSNLVCRLLLEKKNKRTPPSVRYD